ncbi:MAG: alpha/beta hydrolase [Calditrichia bacterium]|nr:alpha/beta hydrolase [Calditrichia bacterium]
MENKISWHYNLRINIPTILFLHAFPANSDMWDPQFHLMKELKLPFIAPDYPGFGKSFIPEMKLEIDDYAHAIFNILQNNGITEVIPVGLSMGGYVALALYRLYPKMFKGLVLADTKIYADTDVVRNNRIKMINDLDKESNKEKLQSLFDTHIDKFFISDIRMNNAQLMKKMDSIFETVSVRGVIEAQRAMAYRSDSTKLVKKMDFPVLFMVGEKDELTTVNDIEKMVNYFPDAQMKVIPNAAHLSNMENPDEFNKSLKKYLEKII